MSFPKVLKQAGYDTTILGKCRIDGILINIRREAASPAGLHETCASMKSILKDDLSKKRTETSIQYLQERIGYLEQEMNFLKKFSQLPRGHDQKQ